MNALKRVINEGEELLIRPGVLKPEFDTPEGRRVRVTGQASGCLPFKMGRTVPVEFLIDGEKVDVDGMDLMEVE